jgi:biopolymer transport protein ExbD
MSASVGGKSKTLVLNLTSMIDICAILVIFLVMGTEIGQADLVTPEGLKYPRSFNKEVIETAPQVVVFRDEVDIRFTGRKIPLQTFRNVEDEVTKRAIDEINKYVAEIPPKLKGSGVLLNLVADRDVPYKTIYEVSKFFRQNGFQSILFVAEGN